MKRNADIARSSALSLWTVLLMTVSGVVVPGSSSAEELSADIAAGRSVFFHRCVACHEPISKEGLTQDELSIYDNSLPATADEMTARGPVLYGLVGRAAGTQPDFAYSPALANAGFQWTDDNLRQFLLKPAAFLPGNSMHFNGLKREGELDALMAYLRATATAQP